MELTCSLCSTISECDNIRPTDCSTPSIHVNPFIVVFVRYSLCKICAHTHFKSLNAICSVYKSKLTLKSINVNINVISSIQSLYEMCLARVNVATNLITQFIIILIKINMCTEHTFAYMRCCCRCCRRRRRHCR